MFPRKPSKSLEYQNLPTNSCRNPKKNISKPTKKGSLELEVLETGSGAKAADHSGVPRNMYLCCTRSHPCALPLAVCIFLMATFVCFLCNTPYLRLLVFLQTSILWFLQTFLSCAKHCKTCGFGSNRKPLGTTGFDFFPLTIFFGYPFLTPSHAFIGPKELSK